MCFSYITFLRTDLLYYSCWDLVETYYPGCYLLCFYSGSRSRHLGLVIILGADTWSCLCCVGVLVLVFCCPLCFLGECGDFKWPDREFCQTWPLRVLVRISFFVLGADSYSWRCARNRGVLRGAIGGMKAGCAPNICLFYWECRKRGRRGHNK